MPVLVPETHTEGPAKPTQMGRLGAVWWALAGATCTSGVWALALTCSFAILGITIRPSDATDTLAVSLLLGGAAVVIGLLAGVTVGSFWGGEQRLTFAALLGLLGVLTGAIGGGLSAPAVVAFGADLHPIASSALAWALAGSVVGLLGCHLARWARLPEPPEEEPATVPAPHRIEWLLHQQERRLSDWPLFHVLPILVASALALVGAVVLATSDESLALAAVGVLGLTVALVTHAQGHRLRNLEARLRELEHQSRPAPEDNAR